MIKTSLWPTDVYQTNIGRENCEYLYAAIVTYEAQNIPPEDMNKFGAFELVKDAISSIGKVTIEDVWIRTAEPVQNNNFEVHCDSHKGTDYIGVLWLTGNEGCGGDIVLYDPAWRNPQHMRFEDQQRYSLKHRITFKVGELVLFPSNVWHEVTTYTGDHKRLSLNFAINIDGSNS